MVPHGPISIPPLHSTPPTTTSSPPTRHRSRSTATSTKPSRDSKDLSPDPSPSRVGLWSLTAPSRSHRDAPLHPRRHRVHPRVTGPDQPPHQPNPRGLDGDPAEWLPRRVIPRACPLIRRPDDPPAPPFGMVRGQELNGRATLKGMPEASQRVAGGRAERHHFVQTPLKFPSVVAPRYDIYGYHGCPA